MAQYSYQEILLSSDIVLQWPFSYTSPPLLLDINSIEPSANGFTITFPNATLAQPGEVVEVNNISAFSFTILANDGITVIATFPAGQIANIQLIDNATTNGTWRIIPFQSSASGITAFQIASSDGSIDVVTTPGGGAINPPGGTVDITMANPVATAAPLGLGYMVNISATKTDNITRSLVAGTNITISNPDGVAAPTQISLSSSVTGLTLLQVGSVTVTGNVISNNVANGNIQLNSNGTGTVQLNGAIIDTSQNISNVGTLTASNAKVGDVTLSTNIITTNVVNGNIQLNSNGTGNVSVNNILINASRDVSNVNNLIAAMATLGSAQLGNLTVMGTTITNGFTNGDVQLTTSGTGKVVFNGVTIDTSGNITGINNIIAPKSWVLFTDSLVVGNVIAIKARSNIFNVTGGAGIYTITFGTPFTTTDYGVEIAFGNNGGEPFQNYFGYWLSKALNQVTIIVVDIAGNYVPDFPDGISVSIMAL